MLLADAPLECILDPLELIELAEFFGDSLLSS